MAIIRQNSVSGINSITAQSNALDFYDNTGNKLTIGADVTGNVIGNLTGNVTGNATGISTTQITVGDAFIKAGSVGVGTTTTVGRNAGISTAVGSIIYIPETGLQIYTGDTFGWKIIGDTAAQFNVTGGTIDTVSRSGYTIHTFSGLSLIHISEPTRPY